MKMKTWFKQMCGLGVLAVGVVTSAHAVGWGDEFAVGASGSLVVGGSPGSARFTASSAMTITGATVNLNLVIPNGSSVDPTLHVGLQVDDGSGAANGVYLGSGSVTATSGGDWNVNFGSSVSLTAGTVYHLVVSNATPGSLAFWRELGNNNTHQPRDNFPDTKWGDGFAFSAGSFGPVNPVYLLHTASGANYGQPYTTASSLNGAIFGTTIKGEQFVYQGPASFGVEGVRLRLETGASTPSDGLSVALLDLSNTVLGSGSLSASSVTLNSLSEYYVALSGLPTLTVGTGYRLVVYSSGALAGDWDMFVNNTLKPVDTAWNSATFQGISAFGVVATSASLGTAVFSSQGDNTDYFFVLVPEPTTATLLLLGAGLIARRRFHRA